MTMPLGFVGWFVGIRRGLRLWGILGFFHVVAGLEVAPAFNARAPTRPLGEACAELDAQQEGPMRIFVVTDPQLGIGAMAVAVAARSRTAAPHFARDPGLNQFLA